MGRKRKADDKREDEDAEEDPLETAFFAFQEATKLMHGETSILASELQQASDTSSGGRRSAETDIEALLKLSIGAAKEAIDAIIKADTGHNHSQSHSHECSLDCEHGDGQLPEGPKALLSDASVLLGRLIEWREPRKARRLYEDAIEANAMNPEAYLQLGRYLYNQAIELDRAELLLRKSIELSTNADDEEVEEEEEGEKGETCYEANKILARLLCQSHGSERKEEAHSILASLGFKHCLSHQLTSSSFLDDSNPYPNPNPNPNQPSSAKHQAAANKAKNTLKSSEEEEQIGGPLIHAWDNAYPPTLLGHLKKALGPPSAPFWIEHAYNSPATGFFSYQYPLEPWKDEDEDEAEVEAEGQGQGQDVVRAEGSLSRVLHHLRALAARVVPETKEALFAEFWAHSRGHTSGHKLHFDYIMGQKDQGNNMVKKEDSTQPSAAVKSRATRNNGSTMQPELVPLHPIVSTVSFLSPPCGGPTLVTDQIMVEGSRTTRGWMVGPRENRVIVFKGSQLHCVLPGVGTRPVLNLGQEGSKGKVRKEDKNQKMRKKEGEGEGPRRVTFMVSFWKQNPNAPPFPPVRSDESASHAAGGGGGLIWPGMFQAPLLSPPSHTTGYDKVDWQPVRAPVIDVPHVYEQLLEDSGGSSKVKASRSRSKQGGVSSGIDLLSSEVFTDLSSSLGSGILIGGAESACSLNCGGKCPACVAAKKAKKV